MAQRVIVFEKDASFVRELEQGFGQLGLTVETMREADAAIVRVREGDVRLILLSVDAMGAPGEAFLVCKRFKSEDDLAKVPLVIMGGPQHAESFESHKKLKKRRADEYVQLPTSFANLLAQLEAVTGLSAADAAAPEDDGVHFIDDESVGEEPANAPAQAAEADVGDEDIDAFAENAFGELLRDEDAKPPAPKAEPFVSALRAEPAAELDPVELERLRDDAAIASRRAQEAEQRLSDYAAQVADGQRQLGESEDRLAESERKLLEAEARLAEGERKLADLELRMGQAEQRAQAAESERTQATAKQEEAEARAEVAERRAKELAATPAPAPATAGISSRDYLDLREQLNRKDKEILSLRDEVTQRDRQLLDASDRTLGLERAQAELHDNMAATQRQLDDAQAKIKAYEVDRESVNKRLEDFRGRAARAEDKGKKLEDELEALKVSSAREVSELKAAHEQASSARDQAAASEVERLKSTHAAALGELESRAQRELADAHAARDNQLASQRAAHERTLAEARAAHDAALEDRRRAYEAESEERRKAAEAALASAIAEAQADKQQALDALAAERTQELERRLADAERAKNAALAGLSRELEGKFAAERKELEDKAAQSIASLQSQLSESEQHGKTLEVRLAELEQAKTALDARLSARIGTLEGDLEQRTQERDSAQNELSAMRASIASLERSGAQLSDRLSALEADLGRANERIDQQSAKIALDKELLDRVRRALGIGIGLLEQQKHNVV